MKITVFVTAKDGQDGSFGIKFHNSLESALEYLGKTEEELSEGCFYDDGDVNEVELEIDNNGKLLNSPFLSFGE